ncbi:hypothetical protein O1611_g9108 [Lasiodiplodia mahajangana]|uniref:Uncharacterized protein n=1 Tax=Lasiodiplodia mahajangana TaxID=1108764 RepID=A0ACC2JAV3_9PEZI|nr:hypothetical protein O1611_g9108 [Lasiodiplodia mahajangana]
MDAKGESKETRFMREAPGDAQRRNVRFQMMDTSRMLDIGKHVYFGLAKRRSAYLTDKGLKLLNIKCTGLDLSTGNPSDGSDTFIRPFSVDRIREILAQTQPDEDYDPPRPAFTFTRYNSAFHLVRWLLHYLEDSLYARAPIDHTEWQTRGVQWDDGENLERCEQINGRGPDWKVMCILDKMDSVTSHVSCLLIEDAPLRDAQLCNSEIWCILAITYRRMKLPEYRNHRIIPVTVITTGFTRTRVVQGYIDTQEGCVRARKSPIFDYEHDDPKQIIEILLSWCIGETVGDTKAQTS